MKPLSYLDKFDKAISNEEITKLWNEVSSKIKDIFTAGLLEEARFTARQRVNPNYQ